MTLEQTLQGTEYKKPEVRYRQLIKPVPKMIKNDGVDASNLDYGVIKTKSGLIYVGRYEGKGRNGI